MTMLPLLWCSAKAVSAVLLAALAGTLLVRFGIVKREQMRVCSTLLFYACLPCLLFTGVSESIDLDRLKSCWIILVSCLFIVTLGIGLGALLAKLRLVPPDFARGSMAALGFGNSAYLSIPLLAAVVAVFPAFKNTSPDLGIAYISVFLMCSSPLLWTVGVRLLSADKDRNISWGKIFSPPVIAMLAGVTVGMIPPLKGLICADDGVLNPLFKSARLIGNGTVPLALLILGSVFAIGPGNGHFDRRALISLLSSKLILMPLIIIIYIIMLRYVDPGRVDALMAVMLVIQAAVPPANSLAVICNLCNHEQEERMASVLFWAYLLCIPTLTVFIMLAVKLFT